MYLKIILLTFIVALNFNCSQNKSTEEMGFYYLNEEEIKKEAEERKKRKADELKKKEAEEQRKREAEVLKKIEAEKLEKSEAGELLKQEALAGLEEEKQETVAEKDTTKIEEANIQATIVAGEEKQEIVTVKDTIKIEEANTQSTTVTGEEKQETVTVKDTTKIEEASTQAITVVGGEKQETVTEKDTTKIEETSLQTTAVTEEEKQQPVTETVQEEPSSKVEYGKASYYGNVFHGRPTASGELYDRNKLTAAHRTLPFGTICKVTNLSNGKSVRVRINDRGPHTKKRIIDLSYKAMSMLDGIAAGIIDVKVEVVKK